jgi:pilus assembly protein FimV
MAFNKSKTLESALKYLNQGKIAQAIGEYQQILRHDAKDQATLMTVGDLFARQGDMPQAIEYFERLAHVYLNDGFNSKAIAIYKKIAKLAPNELAPLEKLADLYVQQGVLSEARPLFLQIAEAHLKANHAPKAVEVLNRLLEVEPENPRVQMRLAELYNVMGQKKEAAQTYFGYAQRLFERGDAEEAPKLIERALEVDPSNAPARLLKAKILAAAGKTDEAIAILEKHPEADAGDEVTNLLVSLELKSGHMNKAADRARNQLVRGSAHFGLLERVVDSLMEAGKAHEALPLLRELRDPMIEAGEQDKFLKSLSDVAEKMPGEVEPLEMLADFSRHTSDPFHLTSALTKLVDIYAADGNYSRAEELMQELIEQNKGDERLVARLDQLRRREQGDATPAETQSSTATTEAAAEEPRVMESSAAEPESTEATPAAAPPVVEESLDEETQRYIAQALTDVDLFSSYGLTQKATHLLENVLQRAPRHTPTLERLLDFYLGAGNERRTAELAAELEQIHRDRQDTVNADRFAELRRRFAKAADLTDEKLAAAPAATPIAASIPEGPVKATFAGAISTDPEVARAVAAEFEIPVTEVEPEAPIVDERKATVVPAEARSAPVELKPVTPGEEVDLSDEWEAMVQEVAEPATASVPQAPPPAAEPVLAQEERIEIEVPAEPEPMEVQEAVAEPASEPVLEIVEVAEEAHAATSGEFELELAAAEPAGVQGNAGAVTTDDFLSELAAEVEDLEAPTATAHEGKPEATGTPEPAAVASAGPVETGDATGTSSGPVPQSTAETLNELAEVFQEFRSELGELGGEDEDLETHYNLGIAYREMGLLDEAIGEFQKVAQAVRKGKPFPYAMNCSTLLAISFLDKGEPKIASLWYQRALETPGLDQEAVLALRYDLGVSLDLAGESSAALDSFRQVYAINIDYRDVADRIAVLQKT